MGILIRIGAAASGTLLFVIIIWLYFLASGDQAFLLPFGLGTALLAPLGFELLKFAITASSQEALKKLVKISQIDELHSRALSTGEEVKALEEYLSNLEMMIPAEIERLALVKQRDTLERSAVELLRELESVEAEIESFGEPVRTGIAAREVTALRDRLEARERGSLVLQIGRKQFIIERSFFALIPFYGAAFDLALAVRKMVRSRSGKPSRNVKDKR